MRNSTQKINKRTKTNSTINSNKGTEYQKDKQRVEQRNEHARVKQQLGETDKAISCSEESGNDITENCKNVICLLT